MKSLNDLKLVLIIHLLSLVVLCLSTSCSHGPVSTTSNDVENVSAYDLELYALSCYENGMDYLNEDRYDLARERFSVAVESATSPVLRRIAMDGLARVDRIIKMRDFDSYSAKCYEDGISYLQSYRYELARERFSMAADAAVSEEMRKRALDSLERVDRMIIERR